MALPSNRAFKALVSAAAFTIGATVSAAFAADECKEVRVMVTAGPEEDVLIKYAQSDFEQQTGINGIDRDRVARSLAVPGGTRVHGRQTRRMTSWLSTRAPATRSGWQGENPRIFASFCLPT